KAKATETVQTSLFDRQPDECVSVNGQQWTLADVPYAAPIAECAKLVREGRYHACIALAQAVVESAVLLVWRVKVRKRQNQTTEFVKAKDALHSNSLIGEECKSRIDRLWAGRHAIPQLRPSVESDTNLLEETARTSLGLVNDLARECFGYSQRDGVIVPDHP